MNHKFIPFAAPLIKDAEIDEVEKVVKSGWLSTGPKTLEFEQAFAEYKGVTDAIAVNSCTSALHLALIAAGVSEGDEVITTPMTFCATVNAIIYTGATPVLADIDYQTMNINPEEIVKKITNKTKAILLVHFSGYPCDLDRIVEIAKAHDLYIIEDCAHAIETEYQGKKAGTIGDFGAFSFYATKNVTAGEGGMLLVKSAELADKVRRLRLHGMSKGAWKRYSNSQFSHYQVTDLGYKYNMMDLQAAIALHQLERVEENWKKRREVVARYNRAFSDLPVVLPSSSAVDMRVAHHLYVLRINENLADIDRDDFATYMIDHNVGVSVHYISIPEHPYYQSRFGWNPLDYPNALEVSKNTLSLPLGPTITREQIGIVISTVQNGIVELQKNHTV